MAKIEAFFRLMNSQGAADLHMVAGVAPCLRVQGDLEPVNYKELHSDELLEMLEQITPPARFKEFAVHAEPPGPRSEAPE
jgi:twitching motility protein PilT